jgi:hypothetical protein
MQRMHMVDQNDGSGRLFAAACRAVEHDLDDRQALAVVRQYARQKPFPRDWSDHDILRRVRDAEKVCRRGSALEADVDDQGLIRLGTHDPHTGKLVLSPKRTLPTAEAFVREFHAHPDGRTLHAHASVLLGWTGSRYAEIEDDAARKQLQGWLHDSLRYVFNRAAGEMELVPFDSNPATVNSALESIRTHVHLAARSPRPPGWTETTIPRPTSCYRASRTCCTCRRWTGCRPRRRCSPPARSTSIPTRTPPNRWRGTRSCTSCSTATSSRSTCSRSGSPTASCPTRRSRKCC